MLYGLGRVAHGSWGDTCLLRPVGTGVPYTAKRKATRRDPTQHTPPHSGHTHIHDTYI